MAKMIIQQIIDDLDGSDADESVMFAIDGVQYEIDLTETNARKLRDALAPYVAAGSKVMARNGRPAKLGHVYAGGTVRSSASNDREQNKAIRAWAKRQGRDISDRGRIPQDVVDEYNANAGRNTVTVREVPLPARDVTAKGTGTAVATAVKAAEPAGRASAAAKVPAVAKKTASTAKVPAKKTAAPAALFQAEDGAKVSARNVAKAPARKAARTR